MCLKIKGGAEPKIANRDIRCYKIVLDRCVGDLFTPYRFAEIRIGDTYDSCLEKENYGGPNDYVDFGLHSFKTLKETRNVMNTFFPYTGCIAMCIIPKGSTYYEGKWCEYKSYASDKLTYATLK